MKILEVNQLSVHYPATNHFFGRSQHVVKAVDDVSFHIDAGETLGLVGESGCGKTTLGRAICSLVKPTRGLITLDGETFSNSSASPSLAHRRKLQMIFQDPFSSLDPRYTAEDSIGEALDIHKLA